MKGEISPVSFGEQESRIMIRLGDGHDVVGVFSAVIGHSFTRLGVFPFAVLLSLV